MATRKTLAPSPSALKALARAELRSLAVLLRKANGGGSVHGARRQIKRVRSLLRLLREAMGEEAFDSANASLRLAADALAGQRRAEALVVAAGRFGGSAGARHWQQLAEAHRAASVSEGGIPAAQAFLAAAVKTVGAARLKPQSLPMIEEAFLRSYRKARRELANGFASEKADELHTARKHVIHHLHNIDLLRGHLRQAGKRVAGLEVLREALGDLNDLDELNQLAPADKTRELDGAARLMAKRRAQLLKGARKAASRLFRHKPKGFQKRIGAMWVTSQA